MKRIFVATYCEVNSYGSILQSIGLQKTLDKLGYEGWILKEDKEKTKKTVPGGLKSMILSVHDKIIAKQIAGRQNRTQKFMDDNIRIKSCGEYEQFKKDVPSAHAYIAGSDQIWNPKVMNPLFFLKDVPASYKKIAYAASMGVLEISKDKEEVFFDNIRKFDCISVREKEMTPILKPHIDKTINENIDPVFLYPASEWRKLEKEYPINEPYVLVYPIYWNHDLDSKLKELHKKTGKKIVVVTNHFRKIYADKHIYDVDPAQFLWLIDHADAVVTSSFHGLAMSVIFNKKVSVVINPAAPSRLNSLLELLKVKNCTIDELMDGKEILWTETNERIVKEQIKGIEYLKEALGDDE